MNVRLASLIACAAIAPAFFSAAQAQTQLYFNGFEDYSLGALGNQGLGQGLYVTNAFTTPDPRGVNIKEGNAPFAPGGTRSASIFRTGGAIDSSAPRLHLYFANRNIGGDQVTGALGRNLTGNDLKSMTFSWDFVANVSGNGNITTQPQFGLFDGTGNFQNANAAVIFDIKFDTRQLRYADGPGYSNYTAYTFKSNTWYNFVLSNVDTASHTYDLQVFEYGINDSVVSITGAKFWGNINEIAVWRAASNSTAVHDYNIDNFTITSQIPESSTYAMLIGLSAVALIALRRRFKK